MKYFLKISLLIFIFSVVCQSFCFSQKNFGKELSSLTLVKPPQKYLGPTGELEKASAARVKAGTPWVVYSDRENNSTYFDKNCSESKKNATLNFMEAFVVAEETDDALRLVRFDPANQPFEDKPGKKNEFQFKKGADQDEVGWIRKRNLLLWNIALVDTGTFYTVKAVSVKKLDKAEDVARLIKKGILDLYDYPDKNPTYKNGKDISLFQYLFVYKEDKEKNMVLVAKVNKLSQGQLADDVLGWAPVNQLHIWDNAICLRVNFDQEAVDERKEKGIDLKFFPSVEDAKNFRDGKPKTSYTPLPFYYDPTLDPSKKDNPYLYGFPIIQNTGETNIFKTGYVTNTLSKSGTTVFKSTQQADFNKKFEEAKQQAQKVNLIFVIDGSYRNFMKTTAQALNDIAYIGGDKTMTRNEYSMAAIIYNDNRWTEEPFKTISLRTSKDQFIEKLYDEASKTSLPALNRDNDGAPLYDAIKQACDLFNNSSQTNLIIVMGASTDKAAAGRQAVLDALVKKQAKMQFFQLSYRDGDVYDNFVRDCKYFLLNSAKAFDDKYFKNDIQKGERKVAEIKSQGNTSTFLVNSGIPGSFSGKEEGESFKPEEIKRKIEKLVKDNENSMSSIFARYESNTSGADKNIKQDDEGETKALMAMLFQKGIKAEDLEILASQENYQLFIEAFAPLGNRNLKESILTRTLFMSRKEFQNLQGTFDKLNSESYTTDDIRTNLLSTYKEIILKYKGGNFDVSKIGDKSPDYFMSLITSLPPTGNKLFARKLNDLKDPKKTTDDELYKLKNIFSNITTRLKKIYKDPLSKMEQEEDDFYWVPEATFHIDE